METHGSSFINGRRVSLRLHWANQKEEARRAAQGQPPTVHQRVARRAANPSNAGRNPSTTMRAQSFTDAFIKQEEEDEEKPNIIDQVQVKMESDDEGDFDYGLPLANYADGIKKEEDEEIDIKAIIKSEGL